MCAGVAEYCVEDSKEHPQCGQLRRTELAVEFLALAALPSTLRSNLGPRLESIGIARRDSPPNIARPTRNPHPKGSASAATESTVNVIWDMPP